MDLPLRQPHDGPEAQLSLGAYPAKTLAAAKDEALRLGVAVRDGKDPLLTRSEEEAAETFSSLARRYMIEHERKHARAGQPGRSSVKPSASWMPTSCQRSEGTKQPLCNGST